MFSYRLPDKVPLPRRLTLTHTYRPHQPAMKLKGCLLTLQKKGEEMHSLGGTIQSPCSARCLSKDEKWPAAPLTVQNSPGKSNVSTQRHFQRHKNQRFLSAGCTEQLRVISPTSLSSHERITVTKSLHSKGFLFPQHGLLTPGEQEPLVCLRVLPPLHLPFYI